MKQNLFNKLWLRVGMIVAIMTTALSGTAWAADESVDFSAQGYSNQQEISSYTGTNFSITFNKGTNSNAPKYYTSGTAIRAYGGNTITVSSTSKTIAKIEITFGSSDGSNAITTNVGTYSNGTWTGSSSSIVFTIGGTSGNRRLKTFAITYASASETPTTTTINAAGITNTDVYVGTDAGSLSATVKDNSNTVISGATVAWSGDNDDVATIDESTGAVTLVAAGTVTFTATYEGVSGSYIGSSATYEMTVTSSAPYVQPTTIEITPNYTFWGKTAQFSGNDFSELSGSKDNITLEWQKGNGSTYANQNAMRFYKDNELTFTAPEGYEIKSIELTVSGTYDDLTFSPSGYDNETTTWSGSSETVTMSRPSNASSYATISKFTITIGLPSTDPSISASDVNIAYNATSGSINYTISNSVEGTSLTASTTANWISNFVVGESAVTFTATANEATESRSATVTLTYGSVTKDVTVTQDAAPVIYTTIPALFDAATGTATEAKVTFNNWVVSGVSTNGKNVFVTDNSGNGFVIFNNAGGLDQDYEVGNILSGTAVSCNLVLYNGFAELTGLDANDLTITTGGSVTASNIDLADLAGVNTGALVSYENLTCSVNDSGSTTKYYLTDGTTSIQVYNSLFAFGALEAGKTYNITGVYQQYNNTKEILPRSAADIEEVEAPTTTTITAGTLTNVTINELYDGDMEDITLGDNVAVGTLVYFSLNVTEGYTLESVTVLDASNNEVTLTETQGAWSFYMPNSSVTINATAVQGSVTPITGDKYVKVTSTDDLTDGQYLIVYEDGSVAFNGGLETLDAVGNTIEVTIINDAIAVTEATAAAEVTIAEMEGGYSICSASGLYIYHTGTKNTLNTSEEAQANIITFNDGNVSITVGDYSMYFNSASDQQRFRYFKNAQKAIQLYKKVEATPETRTLNTQGYATFASTSAVNFDDTEITAWAVTAVSGSTITFAQVTGNIAAETGLLLKGAAGATISPETVASGNTPAGNLLEGIVEDTPVNAYEYYGLSGQNFVKVKAGTVKAGRALLPASVVNATSGDGEAKVFTFVFEDDATGIKTIETVSAEEAAQIFNLAGQRISKMQKGINIVNGKKILK